MMIVLRFNDPEAWLAELLETPDRVHHGIVRFDYFGEPGNNRSKTPVWVTCAFRTAEELVTCAFCAGEEYPANVRTKGYNLGGMEIVRKAIRSLTQRCEGHGFDIRSGILELPPRF